MYTAHSFYIIAYSHASHICNVSLNQHLVNYLSDLMHIHDINAYYKHRKIQSGKLLHLLQILQMPYHRCMHSFIKSILQRLIYRA